MASHVAKLLTVAEVAERCGVEAQTVRDWIHGRELIASTVSASRNSRRPRYRVDPANLETFLAGREMREQPAVDGRRRKKPRLGTVIEFFK
jgi:excisionase family DNA binding protein